MYPTFSHFLYDIFGINLPLPIKMFGLWVAFAFVAAGYFLVKELKRKQQEGHLTTVTKNVVIGRKLSILDVALTALLGFLVGYKLGYIVSDYNLFVEDTEAILLNTKGSWIGGVIGATILGFWNYKEAKAKELPTPTTSTINIEPEEHASTLIFLAATSGIFGAKLFNAFEIWDSFLQDPIASLLSFSGLTFYGGLIVAGLVIVYYCIKNKIPVGVLADATAPGLILAYGVGRLGCHFSGDGDWGIENTNPKPFSSIPDWLWSYNYPNNVNNDGILLEGCTDKYCHVLPVGVYPTSVYEFLIGVSIFIVLWSIRKKVKPVGALFFIYLVFNGLERFSIESIRVNVKMGNGLTQAELIAIILIISGIIGTIAMYLVAKKQNHTTPV